ncbi:MAG TPA: thioesterase [Saprospiraceae bacterium]|nr:thioesterase [Saprospiraceae bacterium]HRK80359.1 thioesterase [Saprospiraceae bacterium]
MNAFTAADLVHRSAFVIRSYEIDPHKIASAPALVRIMQEASMEHVMRLQLSVWDLEPRGLSWVLMRQRLHFERLPRLGETVEIITHPSAFERVFTHRDYRMYDAAGQEIAQASTTWLLMQTATRRMARIPADMLAYNELLPASDSHLARAAEVLPEFGTASNAIRFTIHWFDLDFNFHLTNSKYVEWLLASADEDLLRDAALSDMEVHYLAECTLGEEVISETATEQENIRMHRLVRASDGKALAKARSVWKELTA